jgi:hypothetical protein
LRVGLQPSRLRRGEILAGVSALALLVFVFALPWYGLSGEAARTAAPLGVSTSVNGWNGLTNLRWLMLLAIIAGLSLAVLQATQRAPALPVSVSVIATVLGGITVIALIDRVLIDVPGPSGLVDRRVGAFLGLVSACGIAYGSFRSLREEDPLDPEAVAGIPVVTLSRPD